MRIDGRKRRFSVTDNVILLHSACPVRDTLVFPSFGCFGRKRFEYASSGRVFFRKRRVLRPFSSPEPLGPLNRRRLSTSPRAQSPTVKRAKRLWGRECFKTCRYVQPRPQGFSVKKEKALGTRLRYVRTKAKQKGKQIACEHPPSPLRKHPKRGSSDFSEGGVGGAVHRLVNK